MRELEIEYKQGLLLKEIETGNRPAIVSLLREIPDHITPEIVNKLADYLDPGRKPIKSGPKPKKKPLFVRRYSVISDYYYLCENKKFARLILNSDREEFQLIENSELWDVNDKFAPQWKHPHANRKRDAIALPKKADIKTYICEMYGINGRTFEDWRAEYNKK